MQCIIKLCMYGYYIDGGGHLTVFVSDGFSSARLFFCVCYEERAIFYFSRWPLPSTIRHLAEEPVVHWGAEFHGSCCLPDGFRVVRRVSEHIIKCTMHDRLVVVIIARSTRHKRRGVGLVDRSDSLARPGRGWHFAATGFSSKYHNPLTFPARLLAFSSRENRWPFDGRECIYLCIFMCVCVCVCNRS